VPSKNGDAIRAQMRELAETAVHTIRDMLTGPGVPAGVKLRAALAELQSIGTLEPEQIGDTDPDVIRQRKDVRAPGHGRMVYRIL
jgi:hypothetical protein